MGRTIARVLEIWFLVTLAVISSSGKNVCNTKYKNIHPEHSMCKPRNDTCKFRQRIEENVKELLDLHNEIRNSIQQVVGNDYPKERNMKNMQWDHELYLIALKHVLQCTGLPDCSQCHQTDRFHVEQNFAVKTFSSVNQSFNGSLERFKMVIREWAQEICEYNANIIKKFDFVGHQTNWTNIFRATTVKVGCASMAYDTQTEGSFTEIYVCNYGPTKLTKGEVIYERAYMNCSKHSNDSNCNVNIGLCKNQSLDEHQGGDISLSSRRIKRERNSSRQWWMKRDGNVPPSAAQCPNKYQQIIEEHSMCKPNRPGCKFSRPYRAFKDKLLEIHNIIRNSTKNYAGLHHHTATNMRVMEWDNELYEIARRYVIQCIEFPDCLLCHQTGDFPVEQNFAIKIVPPSNKYNSGKRFIKVVKEWANELQQYSEQEVKHLSREVVEGNKKNWTNIFRASAWKVGCASISFEISSMPNRTVKEIYICNYGPAKLSIGEEVYETGTSCSNCGQGFHCNDTYNNLCSRDPNQQPLGISTLQTEVNQVPIVTAASNDATTGVSFQHTTQKANVPEPPTESNTELSSTNKLKKNASNSDVLWNCTLMFFNDETCRSEQQCYKAWTVSSNGKQPYIEISIPENTRAGLLFLHNIYIERPSCFTFSFTKDVLNSWSFLTSSLYGIVVRTGSNENTIVKLDDDISDWSYLAVDIPWTEVFVQVGVAAKSYNGAGEQHIKIKDLVVSHGPCPALPCTAP